MIKKLGGAAVVAAVAIAGMTASAALALHISRPEPLDATAKAIVEAARALPASAPAADAPHPWDEHCAAAKVEAELLVTLESVRSPRDFARLARAGIGINVRLLYALRGTGRPRPKDRSLLVALERSIRNDRVWLARFERSYSAATLDRWLAVMTRDNDRLRRTSERLGAKSCAAYFGS